MSHITHFKKQPVNVQYWDYYILCRLNTDATIALQRMEYWDGTKEDANVHAENINDALIQQGKEPTQDTGNWVYKSGDELLWELMGVTGERRLPKLLNFLIDEVGYLAQRNNPINTWDRKKQYCFQSRLVQQHINYLGYIIDYFNLPMARMIPVFYAIELLTAEKCYIDKINVAKVLEMLEKMKGDEKLPHFLKNELVKFAQTFSKPDFIPFRSFAEWKAQICGMHPAKTRNRSRKTADSIPQKRGSNSIEDKTYETNIEDKHKKGENSARVQPPTQQPSLSSSSSKKNAGFEVIFTKQEEAIVTAWEEISECAAPRTEKTKAAAKELVRFKATPENLREVRAWCLRTNGKWYAEHGIDLSTIVSNWNKWKSAKSIASQQHSVASNTTTTSGMSEAEAEQVARDAIEKGKTHGYDIKAHAVCENGMWVVRIDWDGDPLRMRSADEWEKTFNENYEYDQAQLVKGAK